MTSNYEDEHEDASALGPATILQFVVSVREVIAGLRAMPEDYNLPPVLLCAIADHLEQNVALLEATLRRE